MKVFEASIIALLGFSVISILTGPHKVNISMATPIAYVYVVFFSPIFEELICRKVIQDQSNKHIKTEYSIFISALVFATLHFNSSLFVGYFFIGVVWGYYYKKTGNIFVPIFSHFLFNYFSLLIQSF